MGWALTSTTSPVSCLFWKLQFLTLILWFQDLLNLFFIFQPCLAAHFHDNRRNNQQQDAVCASCGQTEHRRRSHK
ncbi:uncharacterized protein BYT42DRAFT_584630, partial [Radiomyces spectabilis]|uniref:uncharacterized protein n=1 Tax=Radiomyces spectabilis TaxID=64574 RepID=UPI00221F67B4